MDVADLPAQERDPAADAEQQRDRADGRRAALESMFFALIAVVALAAFAIITFTSMGDEAKGLGEGLLLQFTCFLVSASASLVGIVLGTMSLRLTIRSHGHPDNMAFAIIGITLSAMLSIFFMALFFF